MTVPGPFVPDAPQNRRQALRRQLRQQRDAFAASAEFAAAQAGLAAHLVRILGLLEPQMLGLYWPIYGEFNAVSPWRDDKALQTVPAALPFARRDPPALLYRAWDGAQPSAEDECGIPSSTGATVEPDVVVVPCVGFTRDGFRLGYGGGFFDRWLAARPGATAVGVAWAHAEIDQAELAPQPHDLPLAMIVTEAGVIAP